MKGYILCKIDIFVSLSITRYLHDTEYTTIVKAIITASVEIGQVHLEHAVDETFQPPLPHFT